MKIFRFEKNVDVRLETIKRGEIYLSSPDHFNDLEDCRLQEIWTPFFEPVQNEKLIQCLKILYPEDGSNNIPMSKNIFDILKDIIEYSPLPDGHFDDNLIRSLNRNSIVETLRKFIRKTTGVCCFFKDVPRHPLMWAHYADSHTGFCVEYEVDEVSAPLYEVNYSSQLPSLSVNELIFCPEESLLRVLTTKNLEWSYEKEVRLINLNIFQDGESGKSVPLPQSMKPVRLFTGANFVHSKNEELLKTLNITPVPYKNI